MKVENFDTMYSRILMSWQNWCLLAGKVKPWWKR